MQRIDLDSHQIDVEWFGKPSPGPVFVCLHGLVDSREIWKPLAAYLSKRGRVLLVDQRAHGTSTAPPGRFTRDDLANDVVAVMDQLEIDRCVLIGHSMGGMVSLAAALNTPRLVTGLALLGTAPHCSERTAQWYERIASAGEEHGIAGLRDLGHWAHVEAPKAVFELIDTWIAESGLA
ncbi:MAG: alpha/beta fold hydrolase [bacterium]|nr:alpha/beta fold hydrolase [bacterium]